MSSVERVAWLGRSNEVAMIRWTRRKSIHRLEEESGVSMSASKVSSLFGNISEIENMQQRKVFRMASTAEGQKRKGWRYLGWNSAVG